MTPLETEMVAKLEALKQKMNVAIDITQQGFLGLLELVPDKRGTLAPLVDEIVRKLEELRY